MSFREFAVGAVARQFFVIVVGCCFMLAVGLPGWAVRACFDGAMIGTFIGLLICYIHYRWATGQGFEGWLTLGMVAWVPPPVAVVVTYSIDAKRLVRFYGK